MGMGLKDMGCVGVAPIARVVVMYPSGNLSKLFWPLSFTKVRLLANIVDNDATAFSSEGSYILHFGRIMHSMDLTITPSNPSTEGKLIFVNAVPDL